MGEAEEDRGPKSTGRPGSRHGMEVPESWWAQGKYRSISCGDSKLFTTENLVSLILIFDDLEGSFVCLALPQGHYK